MSGHLPPSPLSVRVLTTQIEIAGAALVKRLLPMPAWRDRANTQQFSALYQCDLAIAQVTHQVIKRLQTLHHQCHTENKALFQNCIQYYRDGNRAAQSRIVSNAKQYPAAAHKFERRIAQQVAESGREAAIASLLNDGIISETVAQKVSHPLTPH